MRRPDQRVEAFLEFPQRRGFGAQPTFLKYHVALGV
jgi:hypothetical protein